ncbi:MAG: hypothetical protein ABUT20_53865 [Bacteroidota bacterium]
MITLVLFIWPLVIVPAFNYYDYKTTYKGGKPNYFLYFIIRGMLAVFHGIFVLISKQDKLTDYTTLSAWELTVVWAPYLLFQVTSFWLIYEFIRNAWSHRSLFYYDHKEFDSGILDRFAAWVGPNLHIVMKALALVICIISVIVIYQR